MIGSSILFYAEICFTVGNNVSLLLYNFHFKIIAKTFFFIYVNFDHHPNTKNTVDLLKVIHREELFSHVTCNDISMMQ